MKAAIAVFPGTNCDRDTLYAFKKNGFPDISYIWYKERSLKGNDLLILPGGFSFGDYLRTGAISIHSELFEAIPEFLKTGGHIVGICNGFQMLVEAKLLPGFLVRNKNKRFISKMINLRIERTDTLFTSLYEKGDIVKMPIAHTTGNYQKIGDSDIEKNVVFRYVDDNGAVNEKGNPNGSYDNIAGIIDDTGHILGLMPHFERVSDEFLGTDGVKMIRSIVENLGKK